jgi:hypothetical protein
MLMPGMLLVMAATMNVAGAETARSDAEASQPNRDEVMDGKRTDQALEARGSRVRVQLPTCADEKLTRIEKAQADPPLDQLKLNRCPGPRTKIGVAPNGPTKY